jgi:integrase
VPYLIGLLALDSTGARVGEIAAAKVGDLDENRKAWLVRAAVSKTRRARWVELPVELFAVVDRLPAREDRDPKAPLFPIGSADRLPTATASRTRRERVDTRGEGGPRERDPVSTPRQLSA